MCGFGREGDLTLWPHPRGQTRHRQARHRHHACGPQGGRTLRVSPPNLGWPPDLLIALKFAEAASLTLLPHLQRTTAGLYDTSGGRHRAGPSGTAYRDPAPKCHLSAKRWKLHGRQKHKRVRRPASLLAPPAPRAQPRENHHHHPLPRVLTGSGP